MSQIEEIYQLKEWCPSDHRKAENGNITVADITVNNQTVSNTHDILSCSPKLIQVTLVESRTSTGVFRKEMRIEADASDFKM